MKGQFYILAMVFIVSVAVGIAYFTAETKQLEQQSKTQTESAMQGILDSAVAGLKGAVDDEIYSGYSYDGDDYCDACYTVEAQLEQSALERGYTLYITDPDDALGYCAFYNDGGDAGTLSCNLTITNGEDTLATSFTHTYAVPFEIRLYKDENHTEESDYFLLDSTAYYRLTSPNGLETNFSYYYPDGTMAGTWNNTPANYFADGSFYIYSWDPIGNWSAAIGDTVDSYSRPFYVQVASVSIATYDGNDNPRNLFERGELVKYVVDVAPAANVAVDVTSNGQPREQYGWQSAESAAQHESNFTIAGTESIGNLTLTATEGNYFQSNTTSITVIEAFGTYYFVDIVFTNPYADAFATACGYTTWYTNENTTFGAVPFVVGTTGNAVKRINAETGVATLPQVYASKVHIISSMCPTCTGGGGSCFPAGTRIATSDGFAKIESLLVGQLVLSPEGQVQVLAKHETVREGYYTIVAGPYSVNATAEHPFLTASGYKEAKELRVGDSLMTIDGEREITSIGYVSSPTVVYNLKVGGSHEFYANGFAVHNKGGGAS